MANNGAILEIGLSAYILRSPGLCLCFGPRMVPSSSSAFVCDWVGIVSISKVSGAELAPGWPRWILQVLCVTVSGLSIRVRKQWVSEPSSSHPAAFSQRQEHRRASSRASPCRCAPGVATGLGTRMLPGGPNANGIQFAVWRVSFFPVELQLIDMVV